MEPSWLTLLWWLCRKCVYQRWWSVFISAGEVFIAPLHPTLCDPMDCSPPRLLCSWDYPGQNTGEGSHSSPGDLPNPGIKPSLLHCKQSLYHLSHQGNPSALVHHVNWLDLLSCFSHWPAPAWGHSACKGATWSVFSKCGELLPWGHSWPMNIEPNVQFTVAPKHHPEPISYSCEKFINPSNLY